MSTQTLQLAYSNSVGPDTFTYSGGVFTISLIDRSNAIRTFVDANALYRIVLTKNTPFVNRDNQNKTVIYANTASISNNLVAMNVSSQSGEPLTSSSPYFVDFHVTGGSGLGGGEINTASSLGVGASLVSGKVGVDLQFRSIEAVDTKITVAPSGNEVAIGFGTVPLDALSDVNTAGAVNTNVLTFNAGVWAPAAGGGGGGLAPPTLQQGEDQVSWDGALIHYEKPFEVTKPDRLAVIRRFVNNPIVGDGSFTLLTSLAPDISTPTLTDPIQFIRVAKNSYSGVQNDTSLQIIGQWNTDDKRLVMLEPAGTVAASRFLTFFFSGSPAVDEGTTWRWAISAGAASGVLVPGEQVSLAIDTLDRNVFSMLNNDVSLGIPDQVVVYSSTNKLVGLHQAAGYPSATMLSPLTPINGNTSLSPTLLNTWMPVVSTEWVPVINTLGNWTLITPVVNQRALELTVSSPYYKAWMLTARVCYQSSGPGLTRVFQWAISLNGTILPIDDSIILVMSQNTGMNEVFMTAMLPINALDNFSIVQMNRTDSSPIVMSTCSLTAVPIL